jgi:hypothetical protein
MGFSYDLTTNEGVVRMLIPDTDPDSYLLDDDELTAMLALEGTVRSAAALALETIASSEAMVSKKIRTQDLSTDGPAVAVELRGRAAALRAQDDTAAADVGLDIVDFDPYTGWLE